MHYVSHRRLKPASLQYPSQVHFPLHPIPMIKAIMRKAPAIGGRRTAPEKHIDYESQPKLGKNHDKRS
jgi:hypothetical protein